VKINTVGGHGRALLVKVAGEVADPPDADSLYEAISAEVREGAFAVEVDLSDVEILTSVGITALLRAKAEGAERGCPLRVVAVSPIVRRVLEVTRLLEHFGLEPG
jgi:anti-anti-sigma factor